jgi:hypothetical protein
MPVMNFLLALLFLIGAIGVFGYQLATGDRRFHILNTNLSGGWLLLLMAGYNLVRWWSVRSYQLNQQALRAQASRVRTRYHEREREHEPDPNFDFTNAPAPPPSSPPTRTPGSEPPSGGTDSIQDGPAH